MIEYPSTELPPELVYSTTDLLNYLQMGEQVLIHFLYKGLVPCVRIIETMYDPYLGELIVSDTREVVMIYDGCAITYTITDLHYPDQDCDLGTGVWNGRPYPTTLDDLSEVQKTGFLLTDYSLGHIAFELNL